MPSWRTDKCSSKIRLPPSDIGKTQIKELRADRMRKSQWKPQRAVHPLNSSKWKADRPGRSPDEGNSWSPVENVGVLVTAEDPNR